MPASDRVQSVFKKAATVALALAATSTVTLAGAQQAYADDISAPPRPAPQAASAPQGSAALDKTGNTIPKTNYAIPAGAIFASPNGNDSNAGTQAAPVKSINRAVKLASDGGTIVLRRGEFRDWYHDAKNPKKWGIVTKALTFQAYPGESPWLNGADLIPDSAWTKNNATTWSMPWSTPQFCDGQYYTRAMNQQSKSPNNGPCSHFDMTDPSNPMAGDPQMLFSNGTPLKQVASKAQLTAKTFFYDWNERRMYLGAAPSGRTIEAAVRPVAMVLSNKQAGFRIQGVGFHRYATNQYHNMTNSVIYVGGSKAVIENSTFAYNAAGGPNLSHPVPGSAVRRTVFAYNGYTALGANGTTQSSASRSDLVVSDNVFYRNNYESFGTKCTLSCGQAAAKFAHMVGLTVANNRVEETQGKAHGLWCDLDCRDVKFVHNTLLNNKGGAGIFYEVSSSGIIAGNVVSNSVLGLSVASATTKVYNNTLVDNVQGMNVYDDNRSPGVGGWKDVGPDTRGVELVNNVVSGQNYSLKTASNKVNPVAPNTGPENFFARVDHNVYHQSNGKSPVFVAWRARNGVESLYRTKDAFYSARGLDKSASYLTGSTDPLFVNKAKGDYRLRAGSPAYNSAGSLPADVARALGAKGASVNRSGAPTLAQ